MDDSFNNLFNAIMGIRDQQQELDQLFTYISTPEGEKLQNRFKRFFQTILNQYKNLYPQWFKDVEYEFEFFSDQNFYIYGEVFSQQIDTIRINLYPFISDYYYNNTSIKVIFDKIKTGSYDGMEGPLVEHQLAHIIDIKKGKRLTRQNVHGRTFRHYLTLLLNKEQII